MSLKVVNLFRPAVRACWITTYNLDLGLFDGFLFNRLGDPPLNVTVLADGHHHDETLAALTVDEPWRIDRVNRRWLLRPVHHIPTFHPKTLLFVEASKTTLLVGSGNLSYSGLDAGKEVFTIFTSETSEGRAAISGWHVWMRDLLDRLDDPLLRRRFSDLHTHLPTLPAPGGGFVHNLYQPLLGQFVDAAPSSVRTLLLTAPFFDTELDAVGELLTALQPVQVELFLADHAKIDGAQLQAIAQAAPGSFRLRRYEQAAFVHAKLAGAIGPDGHGVLLSGSANLSNAALVRSSGGLPPGNVEVGVLAALPGEQIQAAFTDPGKLDAVEVSLDAFATHTADYDGPDQHAPAIRLLAAHRREDRSITFQISNADGRPLELEPTQPEVVDAHVTDGKTVVALDDTEQLSGRLVWLVDSHGAALSNRVVVTETAELERHLNARASSSSQPPSELYLPDLDTPLGAVLMMLHENYIMDVTETDALAGAERAAGSEDTGDDADSELWDRLARDTLAYDPRASSYRGSATRTGNDGRLLELLATMLARSPAEVRDRFDNVIAFPVPHPETEDPEGDDGDGDGPAAGYRWADSTRIRIRARNVLKRWAAAIGDERLLWLDAAAPAVNYQIMIDALSVLTSINRIPEQGGLTDDDLTDLLELTCRAIASIWPKLDTDTRSRIDEHTIAATTALVAFAVRHGPDRRSRTLRWQPLLIRLRSLGLVLASDKASLYLSVVFEHTCSTDGLARTLQDVIDFLDDPEWIRRIQQRLDLTNVRFDQPAAGQLLDVLLHSHGIERPLADPRTPQLLDAIRAYRNASRIALHSSSGNWRLVLCFGDHATLKAPWLDGDDGYVESLERVSDSRIEQIINSGSSLAELFLPEHRAA